MFSYSLVGKIFHFSAPLSTKLCCQTHNLAMVRDSKGYRFKMNPITWWVRRDREMFPLLFSLTLDIYPYPYLIETGNLLQRCLMGKLTDGPLTFRIEKSSMTDLVGVTNGMPCIRVTIHTTYKVWHITHFVCRVLPKMSLCVLMSPWLLLYGYSWMSGLRHCRIVLLVCVFYRVLFERVACERCVICVGCIASCVDVVLNADLN